MVKQDNNLSVSEYALIQRAQSGDDSAFSALAERYSKRIYNIGLRMLNSSEDAADMTQEALIKIYRYINSFRGESSFSTWIYRISVNCCRDFLRAQARRKEITFSDFSAEDDNDPVFEIADNDAVPEKLYLANEQRQYLLSLIDELSYSYRIVILLREIGGLSYQEIAEAVDISIGTVKSRLARARTALAEKIIKEWEQN